MYPIDFEVQRSRSQCINYRKWFRAHNCFPFTPIIMKLHMQTPHESRMCPIDFEVKRSKVKVTMEILISWKIVPTGGGGGVFVPIGQPRSSLHWHAESTSCFFCAYQVQECSRTKPSAAWSSMFAQSCHVSHKKRHFRPNVKYQRTLPEGLKKYRPMSGYTYGMYYKNPLCMNLQNQCHYIIIWLS